ncbi:MAG: porphobilinogen synthase [Opitutales bacterium]
MEDRFALDLQRRPRRLRRTAAIRDLVRECTVTPADLIQPLFVIDGEGQPEPVDAMPGQVRHTLDSLMAEAETLLGLGVRAVALFPRIDPELKTPAGDEALNPETLVLRAVRRLKQELPELVLVTDVALDPYTTHGHDGLLSEEGDEVENDATVEVLNEMAALQAEAGVDFVAPSDMMDGRVGSIRESLDEAGYRNVGMIAYAAKFASAYYGPFRDAVGSAQAAGTISLDKRTYQLDPANRREALLESLLDEQEGADVLMVKPAGPYLDIVRELRDKTLLPVAAYQVSGEYAQIQAAAERGWLDGAAARDESLLAIKRAGADLILTYFARVFAEAKRGA